jgi:hypothetical protein
MVRYRLAGDASMDSTASPSVNTVGGFLEENDNLLSNARKKWAIQDSNPMRNGSENPDASRESQHEPLQVLCPELAQIVAAWPKLPKAIRRAILALIESA